MKRLLLILVGLSPLVIYAQNINPGADEIYREDEIAKVYLTMSSEDSVTLLDDVDVESEVYLPTGFRFVNSLMDTTLNFNVGIRLRGNTSRYHPKKSLKIKFKEFDGSKFYGYKKFNLKAENNDPSFVRESLSLQTFRNANVAAARTHHTEVYMNGGYLGLYLNVEQLDDEFVASRFGNDTGNLYKCGWGATLENIGQVYNNDIYEIEINDDINDRSILEHFVSVLNNTSNESFKVELEKVFDVQPFLRYLAVEALTGHWDGYSYNQNNFYLYENPDNGLIEFMPYDADNTFGLDWLGEDWGTRDVLNWPIEGEPRPLTKRILAVDTYFDQYVEELNNLLETYFTETFLFPQLDAFKTMLADAVSRDTYFPLTFGFTYQDFINSFTLAIGGNYGQLPYGVKPYITTRSQTAKSSLAVLGVDDEINLAYDLFPNPSDGYYVSVTTNRLVTLDNVCVFDSSGRKYNTTIKRNGSSYQIDFDNKLPPGLYVLLANGKACKMLVK